MLQNAVHTLDRPQVRAVQPVVRIPFDVIRCRAISWGAGKGGRARGESKETKEDRVHQSPSPRNRRERKDGRSAELGEGRENPAPPKVRKHWTDAPAQPIAGSAAVRAGAKRRVAADHNCVDRRALARILRQLDIIYCNVEFVFSGMRALLLILRSSRAPVTVSGEPADSRESAYEAQRSAPAIRHTHLLDSVRICPNVLRIGFESISRLPGAFAWRLPDNLPTLIDRSPAGAARSPVRDTACSPIAAPASVGKLGAGMATTMACVPQGCRIKAPEARSAAFPTQVLVSIRQGELPSSRRIQFCLARLHRLLCEA